MGAAKGNTNALGNNGGAPSLYDIKYCEQIVEYFDKPAITYIVKKEFDRNGDVKSETQIPQGVEFPTFQGFANKIDVNMSTLTEWRDVHIEFSKAYARAKDIQERILVINSLNNQYNSQFAQFFAKNCLGYKDKVEVDQNITGDFAININVVSMQDLHKQELLPAKKDTILID
jgi:hypothetical protein